MYWHIVSLYFSLFLKLLSDVHYLWRFKERKEEYSNQLFGAQVSFFLNLFLFCWSIIIDVGFLQLYFVGFVFNIIFIVILL